MIIKISENIAFLRKNKGITQDELAKALNVSNQAVSKWEAGKCCPDIELLPELACLFKVSIDELIVGDCLVNDKIIDKKQDTLFLKAIKIAEEDQRISTSLLQRKLSIGYGRAKKIIDEMCNGGYIVKDHSARVDSYLYNK